MRRSAISHLSPLLHFTGHHGDGWVACFCRTKIAVAEGNFAGPVDFGMSHVEKIGDLRISIPEGIECEQAASFLACFKLKAAEGTFPTYVDFCNSGVSTIGDLTIHKPNKEGTSAKFRKCYDLILPKNWLNRTDIQSDPTIMRNSQEAIAKKIIKEQTEIEI